MSLDFTDKVVIVTGAGGGLGKSHALEFARRGAKVVVNDLGGAMDGSGGSSDAAEAVVAQIKEAGGEAIANGSSVTDDAGVDNMIKQTMDAYGRIDVLVNNAGVLRDKSFAKMEIDDFTFVVDVHLFGTMKPTKAVWPIMKEQGYGRIMVTSLFRSLRQFRPVQLWRGQAWRCRLYEYAEAGRPKRQYPHQRAGSGCLDADDGKSDAG